MSDLFPVHYRISEILKPFCGYCEIIKILQILLQRLANDSGAALL